MKEDLAVDNDDGIALFIMALGKWNTLIQRDPDFDEYNDIVNEHCNFTNFI